MVEKEAGEMPILNDILDHPVLGREFQRGLDGGWERDWSRVWSGDATTAN